MRWRLGGCSTPRRPFYARSPAVLGPSRRGDRLTSSFSLLPLPPCRRATRCAGLFRARRGLSAEPSWKVPAGLGSAQVSAATMIDSCGWGRGQGASFGEALGKGELGWVPRGGRICASRCYEQHQRSNRVALIEPR
jgi:hypothetical protein